MCYNSVVIDAPVETVWKHVSNFYTMDKWANPVITECKVVDSSLSAKTIGAQRVLNGCFEETLVAFDEINHCFSYSIDNAPGTCVESNSCQGYLSTWKLYEITNPASGKTTGQTFLVQSSVWSIGDSQAILDFCNPIYRSCILALKAFVEKENE